MKMSLNLRPQTEQFISDVFASYCQSYKETLASGFAPWTSRRTIHESNQVHRFLDAYRKNGKNIITWTELPIPMGKDTAHIDGFIIDEDRKCIYFIEAKRFSRPSQFDSLKEDVNRLYKIAHDIYVNDQHFKGLDLLEYDSFLITLADILENKSNWTQAVVENWRKHSWELECIYSVTIASEIQNIFEDYNLIYTLMPIFDATEYKKEVEIERHEFSPAANPSILVYADEVGFEPLLAAVNKKKHKG